ncbi:MAG: hypothetical protein KBC69_03010 [Candidatus Magasanikbacteria bacterium]|nr:hypothetical protein [Candidatus Magasanikbacteria bacterium]
MRIALSSLALALALIGCTDPDVNIVDGGPTPDGPKLDAETTEVDAGIDAPGDICLSLGTPPEGAYLLGEGSRSWRCGFSAAPGNHNTFAIAAGTDWMCSSIRVEPTTTAQGPACLVSCMDASGNTMDQLSNTDYRELTVERAGATMPYRFYYGIPGTPPAEAEFVCHDPATVPFPS